MDKLGKLDYADEQEPNYDGFLVIGAGLGRTGTMSLRAALGKLLKGRCYHAVDIVNHGDEEQRFWNEVFDGEVKTDDDWKGFLEGRGYRAGVDLPIGYYYRELMKVFPEAKVVLTVRDPGAWYESVHGSIYQASLAMKEFPCIVFGKMMGIFQKNWTAMRISYTKPEGFDRCIFGVVAEGREASVRFFDDWVRKVKANVPQEKLLVFECKQGWKPLCEFLDLPIPDEPFPRVNDTKQMLGHIRKLRFLSYFFVYFVPTLIFAVLSYAYFN